MADWPYNTGRWSRLRLAHLKIEPLCRGCKPRVVPANVVDHVKAISDGGEAFPGHDGLASYCARCHSSKTARGPEAGAAKTNRPRKGCTPDGRPIDANHPWSSLTGAGAPKIPEIKGERTTGEHENSISFKGVSNG